MSRLLKITIIALLILVILPILAIICDYVVLSENEQITIRQRETNVLAESSINNLPVQVGVSENKTLGNLTYIGASYFSYVSIRYEQSNNWAHIWLRVDEGSYGNFAYNFTFTIKTASGAHVNEVVFKKDPVNTVGVTYTLFNQSLNDNDYVFYWSGEISRISGKTPLGGNSAFVIDNTAPTLTNSDNINTGAIIGHPVTFYASDRNFRDITFSVRDIRGGIIDSNSWTGADLRLPNNSQIARGEVLKISVYARDKYGNNSQNIDFTYDPIAPDISLRNVVDGGVTPSNVTIEYSDNIAIDSAKLYRHDGNEFRLLSQPASGSVITSDGYYKVSVTDRAGNLTNKSFYIDTTRPYVNSIPALRNIFKFNQEVTEKLGHGNTLSGETVDLGYTAQMFSISFGDIIGDTVGPMPKYTITYRKYLYNDAGIKSILDKATYNSLTFNEYGSYEITLSNAAGKVLIISFEIDIKSIPEYNEELFRTISDNELLAFKGADIASISRDDFERGARIIVNGNLIGNNISYNDYIAILNGSNSAEVKIGSDSIGDVIKKRIYVDVTAPELDNIDELSDLELADGEYIGISRSSLRFNFTSGTYEFNETAILKCIETTFNQYGVLVSSEEKYVEYVSGQLIEHDGYYELTITDENGNYNEWKFTIINQYQSSSKWSLENEYFMAPYNYSVKLPIALGSFILDSGRYPGEYNANCRYMFESEGNALEFAYAAEYSVCVVEQNSRWLYKPGNKGIQIAYSNKLQLDAKIMSVVKAYVTETSEFRLGNKSHINRGIDIIMDKSLKYNEMNMNVGPIIINDIEYNNILLADKNMILTVNQLYNHSPAVSILNIQTGSEYQYNPGASLGEATGGADGLYRICEQISDNLKSEYYIYIDNVAPIAQVWSIKADSNDQGISETITPADEIVYQVAEFRLESVTDIIDNYSLAYISGRKLDNVYYNQYPSLKYADGYQGEYAISIYDRSGNAFSFKVYIMDAPPAAVLTRYGSGDTEYALIEISYPKYCVAMSLTLEHNGKLMNNDSDGNSVTETTTKIITRRGGRYKLCIIDNYNRTTIIELKYVKDMPDISLVGLKIGGITNQVVTIKLAAKALYSVEFDDGRTVLYDINTASGQQLINVHARDDNNGKVIVRAWYEADPDAYNDTYFIIDTIPPELQLVNENHSVLNGVVFGERVYLSYDASEVSGVNVRRGTNYINYVYGQALYMDGEYDAIVIDRAGNQSIKSFVIDMQVQFTAIYDKIYHSKIETVAGKSVIVTRSFMISPDEQMIITVLHDGYLTDIGLNDAVTANGLYEITVVDSIGNEESIVVRVISSIEAIKLETEDGALLSYGAISNKNLKISWDERNYINETVLKSGGTITYGYQTGSLINKEGNGSVTLTDVVGNTLTIPFVIDKTVDVKFTFGGNYSLADSILTTSFKITANEAINIEIFKDGQSLLYDENSIVAVSGKYEVNITDSIGNTMNQKITVINESPKVLILNDLGEEITDGMTNTPINITWTDEHYISSVTINGNDIDNGVRIVSDGKYSILITDLLGRTSRKNIKIKSSVDFTVSYTGNFLIIEDGREITLTRSFRVYRADDSELVIYKDGGLLLEATWGKTYESSGDYRVVVADSLGNAEELLIRVLNSAMLPEIKDDAGNLIANREVIRGGFIVEASEFIDEILVNNTVYLGERFAAAGNYKINIKDVVGNTAVLYITVDNKVEYNINFSKKYEKSDSVILTNGFALKPLEEMIIYIIKNGEEITYIPGAFLADTWAIYNITLTDMIGNTEELRIEVDNRLPRVTFKDTEGNSLSGYAFNTPISINWSVADNIRYISINGVSIGNGGALSEPGKYNIIATNLLGEVSELSIMISYEIPVDIQYGGVFEYIENDSHYVLTDSVVIIVADGIDISASCDNVVLRYYSGQRISKAGYYTFKISDQAGNERVINVIISDVPFSGKLKSDAGVIYDDTTNKHFIIEKDRFTSEVLINEEDYKGEVIEADGRYKITFLDVLGRKSERIVIIDTTVDYEINYAYITESGDYVAKNIRITPLENLNIRYYRDGILLGNILDIEDGVYTAILIDGLENTLQITIIIDSKPPVIEASSLKSNTEISVKITEPSSYECIIMKNGEKIEFDNYNDMLLVDEGNYAITAIDRLGNESSINVDIIKKAPELNLIGKFNENKTTKEVKIECKENYQVYRNGKLLEGYFGSIDEVGKYRIIATDEVGNETVVEFEIVYTPNAMTIIAIILGLLGVVSAVIMVSRRFNLFGKIMKTLKR